MLTEAQEQLPAVSQRGVEDFKRQAASRVSAIIQKLKDQFPADDVEGLVMELDKRKKKKKAVNKKPFLKREDADIVPTLNDIKDAMSRIGDKRNQMTAKQIRMLNYVKVYQLQQIKVLHRIFEILQNI